MKTDRELLELAAKAAGYPVDCAFDDNPLIFGVDAGPDGPREWNPLTDDGDSLRLAVDLGIDVSFFEGSVDVDHESFTLARSMPYGNDKHAATRRAITRAAAAIGEQTK